MILIICLKEIHDHLKSPLFLLGALVVVFLTAYATLIATNDYRQRRDDFLAAQSSFGEKQFPYYLIREPNPNSLSVFHTDDTHEEYISGALREKRRNNVTRIFH